MVYLFFVWPSVYENGIFGKFDSLSLIKSMLQQDSPHRLASLQ